MKTWEEITSDIYYVPQYIELTIKHDNGMAECANGILIDFRFDKSSVPQGWHPYDLRSSDADDSVPVTIEPNVWVNFFGVVLLDHSFEMKNGYLEIEDWCYKDWQDVAVEELSIANDQINLNLIEDWNNLEPISANIARLASESRMNG